MLLRCTYWYVHDDRMESRQRLIETMSDLMWERGYADTSPRDVRDRAGVGQGSMYHHFRGKRELAVAALERTIAGMLPASAQLVEGPGDPMARIEAYLLRPRDALRGCRIGRMTQDAQVRQDPALLAPVARAFAQMHGRWVTVLREAVDAGQLPTDLDVERLAHTLMATLQGGYVLAIAQQSRGPFDDAVAGVLDLLKAAAPAATTEKGK
jgi:AcrR family transcriptional regulator